MIYWIVWLALMKITYQNLFFSFIWVKSPLPHIICTYEYFFCLNWKILNKVFPVGKLLKHLSQCYSFYHKWLASCHNFNSFCEQDYYFLPCTYFSILYLSRWTHTPPWSQMKRRHPMVPHPPPPPLLQVPSPHQTPQHQDSDLHWKRQGSIKCFTSTYSLLEN